MKRRYRRMLQGLARDGRRRGRKEWSLYILRCSDGSLYTGIAKDVNRRLEAHNRGRGSRYVRTRAPAKVLYVQKGMTRSEALVREAQVKTLSRDRKESLARSDPSRPHPTPYRIPRAAGRSRTLRLRDEALHRRGRVRGQSQQDRSQPEKEHALLPDAHPW